jgi:hypothetical protein
VQAAVAAARPAGDGAQDRAVTLACRVRPVDERLKGVELRVEGAFARIPTLDEGLAKLAREYDVGVLPADSSITSTFPA